MNKALLSWRDIAPPAWKDRAAAFAEAVLSSLGKTNWEISLLFCGDDFIQELNRDYRGKDEPTDVLSFAMLDAAAAAPATGAASWPDPSAAAQTASAAAQTSSAAAKTSSAAAKSSRAAAKTASAAAQTASAAAKSSRAAAQTSSAAAKTASAASGKGPVLAGDIVISLPACERNAKDFSVPMDEELKRLLVHGILHLTGFDHQDNDPAQPMLLAQEKILISFSGEHIL